MNTTPIRLVVAGVGGRMGREIVAAAGNDPRFVLVGGTVRPAVAGGVAAGVQGAAAGSIGMRLADDPRAVVPDADVVIDVSAPAGTLAHARVCAAYGVPLVSGVTGLSPDEMDELRRLAERTPILHARNLSPGIAALLRVLPALSAALAGYDLEIVETHHRHKLDAPSGTALALAEAAAGGAPLVHGRSGIAPRAAGEVGIHAVRAGGNPGEHAVVFAAEGEDVRLCHRAFSRRAYADGALRAAAWLAGQQPGFYGIGNIADPGDRPLPAAPPPTSSAWGSRALLTERELAGA